jgi:hypothetical protein
MRIEPVDIFTGSKFRLSLSPIEKVGFRILTVGDSYTFGQGVKQSDTFSRLLEKKLNRSFSSDIEIVNLGKPGANLHEDVAIIKYLDRKIDYDVLVLALSPDDVLFLKIHELKSLVPDWQSIWNNQWHDANVALLLNTLSQIRQFLADLKKGG